MEIGQRYGYVFIDEIQRKDDAGLFLKGLFDLNLPYKFIISGSGSLELKQKIHESLVGRKRLFELSTISFDEFINHRTDYRYEENLVDFLATEMDRALLLLSEYMQFGGYPRIVMAAEQSEKLRLIDEIYLKSPFEKGFVFENLVFLLLKQKLRFKAAKLNYWRTKDKAEVDFVIEAGKKLIPVEVKYKHLKQDKAPASLRSFIDRYKPERAYIINLDLSKTVKINKTTLFFMPFHELLRQTVVL